MARGFVKATLALGAIVAIGAGIAMTGAGAAPSVSAERPTVVKPDTVEPAVFRHSVRSLPQLGPSNKHEFQKPRAWEREFEPSFVKAPPAGGAAPTAPVTEPNAPAPPPGGGGDPFAGSFLGLDFATWGAGWPPDTNGDVGPAYYIQAVNTSIGIFRKNDGARVAAYTFDSLWSGTNTLCDNDNGGDPTVTYDPIGDRWFVADFAFSGSGSSPPYYECIAVSRTGDPVNGGWYLYPIRADDAAHPWFPDYPKMGIWPDGLYMTANMFQGNTFREVRGWAFNRQDMEAGVKPRTVVIDTNTSTYFSMLPSNMRTAAGAPTAGRPNLFVSESSSVYGLEIFKFHADYAGSGSTFTGPTNVSHASYAVAANSAPSPANSLDTLAERLMNQAQYTNINGAESLWVNHSVHCCGTSTGPTGIHWVQVNVTGGNIGGLVQQQVYPGTSDGLHRWMGSLAVDQKGDMALGYSVSSSTLNPDIRYAGRFATDPVGTLPQTETTMLPGVTRGSQNYTTRWGDYSAMTLDPNGCDFWFTTEYYAATSSNWQTRIGSFRLNPNCGTVTGQTPQTITFDPLPGKTYGDADFTVSATATSGLPVSFTATDNCTVSGNTVHLTGGGSCTVTAHQAGDDTYAPAPERSQGFSIAKAGQTISFGPLADKTFGDADFTVSATASSGLAVSFSATGNCTVSGNTVHLTGAGSCMVTASQAGNADFQPATSVSRSFTINPGSAGTHLTLSSTVEGTLNLSAGAWVNGGFHVKLAQSNASPVTVQVNGNVLLPVNCAGGGSGTITVPISSSFTIPAGSTSYTPTNDQRSVLGWMSAVQATVPAACAAGAQLSNTTGATLDANVVSGSHNGGLTFQFHYRVPAAKGKPNTNCTVAGDPNHNTACQAKWSTAKTI